MHQRRLEREKTPSDSSELLQMTRNEVFDWFSLEARPNTVRYITPCLDIFWQYKMFNKKVDLLQDHSPLAILNYFALCSSSCVISACQLSSRPLWCTYVWTVYRIFIFIHFWTPTQMDFFRLIQANFEVNSEKLWQQIFVLSADNTKKIQKIEKIGKTSSFDDFVYIF